MPGEVSSFIDWQKQQLLNGSGIDSRRELPSLEAHLRLIESVGNYYEFPGIFDTEEHITDITKTIKLLQENIDIPWGDAPLQLWREPDWRERDRCEGIALNDLTVLALFTWMKIGFTFTKLSWRRNEPAAVFGCHTTSRENIEALFARETPRNLVFLYG